MLGSEIVLLELYYFNEDLNVSGIIFYNKFYSKPGMRITIWPRFCPRREKEKTNKEKKLKRACWSWTRVSNKLLV